jgi:Putative Ig domain
VTTEGARRRLGRPTYLWSPTLLLVALVSLLLSSVVTGQSAALAAAAHAKSSKAAKSMFPANGYFQVAEKHGRWYFVTPQGAPFYAAGIDTVTPVGDTDQTTDQCPYCEAVSEQFPNDSAWASTTVSWLRSWGFNSLGSFSDDSLLGSQMPYEVLLNMASGDDWFASSFVTHADEVAAEDVAPLADDPNLIGYYTDSELAWGPPDTPNNETVLQEYLDLPAGSPGLAVAEQYQGNPAGFLYALATRYFSVTTAAIRMYDTHHLILGVKAEGQEIQPQLLEAASPYVDVFSVEDYVLQPLFAQAVDIAWPYYLPVESNLADFYQYVHRPIMIGEYSFISAGPQDPNTVPGIYYVSPNQQARATDFENFIAPLYEDAPWVVGDDWFEWYDEPTGGRVGDGENNDFGMVNDDNQPYPTMVAAMELMHSVTSSRIKQSGPECDSWSDTSSGVTCDAYMNAPTYPLTIVTNSLPNAMVGDSYDNSVYAGGGRPPYHLHLVEGSLPKGLKLHAGTGAITGTPKQPGTSSFTVEAVDSSGSTPTTQTLSITVEPTTLQIKASKLPAAVVGRSYSRQLVAEGGTPPFTWSVVSGSPPPGISLGSGGLLSGTTTSLGTYDFTAQVTDQSSPTQSASDSYVIVVRKR